jgi:hypothetical protein
MASLKGSTTGSDTPVFGESKKLVVPPKLDSAADGAGGKGASTGSAGGERKRKQAQGSIAAPLYGRRAVKHFPVSASELKQLGERRNNATTFTSLGTGLIGIGLGLLKDSVFTDAPKTVSLPALVPHLVSPPPGFNWLPIAAAFIIAGIVMVAIGAHAVHAGKSLIERIENETDFDE